MKKLLMMLLLSLTVSANALAQDNERKSNLIIQCVGYEGTEMVGCYEYIHFKVINNTDAVECIPAEEGLHVFYTDFLENDEIKYTLIGSYNEDIVAQPGEYIDIMIKVSHISSTYDTRFGILGTFLDNENKPTKWFDMVTFVVYPARDWDLSGTIQVEQVQNEEGAKIVGHATLTNNESNLFTPFNPVTHLYKKTSKGFVVVENNTIKSNWFEPGVSYNENIEFTNFEQGETYYMDIKWNQYTGVNTDYEIARSEEFTFGDTNAISNVSTSEDMISVYTTEGKLVTTGDKDSVINGLTKGLYIIKNNHGVRKVIK